MVFNLVLALSLVTGPGLGRAEASPPCARDLGDSVASARTHPASAAETAEAGGGAGPGGATAVRDASERAAMDALTARGWGKRARGYAILIATMVASVAAATYLNSILPPQMNYLSMFIGQVSTIGVYIFGAPIWEPLSSSVRQLAFEVEPSPAGFESGPGRLFEQWHRTQRALGLNPQMARNGLVACITSIKHNFYEAKRAMDGVDPAYAADQVAEAAVRLRRLYVDVRPADPDVTLAVRAAFTNHVVVDDTFRREVLVRIHAFDPDANLPSPAAHYADVLAAWLK